MKTKLQFCRLNRPNCALWKNIIGGQGVIHRPSPWSNTEGDISYNHPLYDSAHLCSLHKYQVYVRLCERRHFKRRAQCRAAEGPGKIWNIDAIWGKILLILATNCAFWFSLYFQFGKQMLIPLLIMENFLVPPSGNSKLFWPPPFCPAPPPKYLWTLPNHSLGLISVYFKHCLRIRPKMYISELLLDNFTRLVLKAAEKLIVPSVNSNNNDV